MSICTNCGFGESYCSCSTDVQFSDLSYTNDQYQVPDSLIRSINRFKSDHSDKLDAWTETIGHMDTTERNVRLVYMWATGSIQTQTRSLDELTGEFELTGFDEIKRFLEDTTDGRKKWEKVHEFWISDRPAEILDLIQAGDMVDAQAVLAGLHEDSGRSFHYARPTKANLVTGLFGDDKALCLDSRRHRVLRPLLKDMLPGMVESVDHDHPKDTLGTYRHEQANRTNDSVPAWSADFLQDKCDRSPEELRLITGEILDALESNTRANRDEISHILFCLGGETTFHESLQALIK